MRMLASMLMDSSSLCPTLHGAAVQRRTQVFDELRKDVPSIKLLYTTPEQLAASEALVDRLADLHSRCAMQWLLHVLHDAVAQGACIWTQLSCRVLMMSE
jgi:hypothetical protein